MKLKKKDKKKNHFKYFLIINFENNIIRIYYIIGRNSINSGLNSWQCAHFKPKVGPTRKRPSTNPILWHTHTKEGEEGEKKEYSHFLRTTSFPSSFSVSYVLFWFATTLLCLSPFYLIHADSEKSGYVLFALDWFQFLISISYKNFASGWSSWLSHMKPNEFKAVVI